MCQEYFELFATQLKENIDYDNPVGKLLKQAEEKTKQPAENLVGGAICIFVPLIMYFFGVTIIWFVRERSLCRCTHHVMLFFSCTFCVAFLFGSLRPFGKRQRLRCVLLPRLLLHQGSAVHFC